MVMKWKGNIIADLSREFLDTNGAIKHTDVDVTEKDLAEIETFIKEKVAKSFKQGDFFKKPTT